MLRTEADTLAESSTLTPTIIHFFFQANKSAIALPMGMSTKNELASPPHTQDIIETLGSAETLFWVNLTI
jgi:hypothetical protein